MAATRPPKVSTARVVQAGLLAWLIPGAGHYILGYRRFAWVFFVAISVPYFTGLALGGVKDFVSPARNSWLFLAELPIGGYTIPGFFASQAVEAHIVRREANNAEIDLTDYVAYYPASDVAQIYLAAAGLLNVLAILDAITRAQTNGLPTFNRHLQQEATSEGAS